MEIFNSSNARDRRGYTLTELLVVMVLIMLLVWVGVGFYRRQQENLLARSLLTEAMKIKERIDHLVTSRGIPKYEVFFNNQGWNNPQQMEVFHGFTYLLGFEPCGTGVDCLYVNIQGEGEILGKVLERAQGLDGLNCNLAGDTLTCHFGQ